MIRAALNAITAALTSTVTLREAVAASEFEQALRAVANTPEERAELRELAIRAGQLGMRADDLEPAMRAHFRAQWDAERRAAA